MSRLYEYVKYTGEGRGKSISFDKALELIRKNCKKSLKKWQQNNGNYINRSTSKKDDFYYVNPSKAKELRVSANTRNYYTWVMDNSPLWKKYPKRSKSLICSTGRYGIGFYMFPYDGTKIGVCPYADMWSSWSNTLPMLMEFNDSISDVFYDAEINASQITTVEEFKKACKRFDKIYKSNPKVVSYTRNFGWFYSEYEDNFWEMLVKLLSPKRDNFKLVNAGDKISRDKEVWFSGECIMIKQKMDKSHIEDELLK